LTISRPAHLIGSPQAPLIIRPSVKAGSPFSLNIFAGIVLIAPIAST